MKAVEQLAHGDAREVQPDRVEVLERDLEEVLEVGDRALEHLAGRRVALPRPVGVALDVVGPVVELVEEVSRARARSPPARALAPVRDSPARAAPPGLVPRRRFDRGGSRAVRDGRSYDELRQSGAMARCSSRRGATATSGTPRSLLVRMCAFNPLFSRGKHLKSYALARRGPAGSLHEATLRERPGSAARRDPALSGDRTDVLTASPAHCAIRRRASGSAPCAARSRW